MGEVAQELYSALASIQMGQLKDELDWVVDLQLTVHWQILPHLVSTNSIRYSEI